MSKEEIDRRRRNDIILMSVMKFKSMGWSNYKIAKELDCSISVVKLRINEAYFFQGFADTLRKYGKSHLIKSSESEEGKK